MEASLLKAFDIRMVRIELDGAVVFVTIANLPLNLIHDDVRGALPDTLDKAVFGLPRAGLASFYLPPLLLARRARLSPLEAQRPPTVGSVHSKRSTGRFKVSSSLSPARSLLRFARPPPRSDGKRARAPSKSSYSRNGSTRLALYTSSALA
jgi:hypothetical protein